MKKMMMVDWVKKPLRTVRHHPNEGERTHAIELSVSLPPSLPATMFREL